MSKLHVLTCNVLDQTLLILFISTLANLGTISTLQFFYLIVRVSVLHILNVHSPKVMSMAERKRKMDSTKVVPKYEEKVNEVDAMEDDRDLRNWGTKPKPKPGSTVVGTISRE